MDERPPADTTGTYGDLHQPGVEQPEPYAAPSRTRPLVLAALGIAVIASVGAGIVLMRSGEPELEPAGEVVAARGIDHGLEWEVFAIEGTDGWCLGFRFTAQEEPATFDCGVGTTFASGWITSDERGAHDLFAYGTVDDTTSFVRIELADGSSTIVRAFDRPRLPFRLYVFPLPEASRATAAVALANDGSDLARNPYPLRSSTPAPED